MAVRTLVISVLDLFSEVSFIGDLSCESTWGALIRFHISVFAVAVLLYGDEVVAALR